MKTLIIMPALAQPPKLPYLVEHIKTKQVVLVQEVNFITAVVRGTVVVEGSGHSLGLFCEDWSVLSSPSDWKILPAGTIVTLTQEI